MIVNPETRAAIFNHARRLAALASPQESAGLIIRGHYTPCKNLSKTPDRAFALDPADVASPDVDAIVHSHPGGPACPSHEDMQQQILSGLPWVIVSVPTLSSLCREDMFVFGLPPKLDLMVGYRHGVTDCFSLIRAYYAEVMGINLPEIPRGWGWWHDGGDHYSAQYERLGFTPLTPTETQQPGDVFLARIRAPVINHGGIWLGDGLVLHHLAGRLPHDPTRLPRKEPCARWYPFIRTWLRFRHKKQSQPE